MLAVLPAAGLLLTLVGLQGGQPAEGVIAARSVVRAPELAEDVTLDRPAELPRATAQNAQREGAAAEVSPGPRLEIATWAIEGQVLDLSGVGLSGVSVFPTRAPQHRGVTDASGNFAFEVPAAPDQLACSAPGQRPVGPAPRVQRAKPMILTMAPAAAPIAVRVVSAQSLGPLEGATIRLEGSPAKWTTAATGETLVGPLPTGQPQTLRISSDRHVDVELEVTPDPFEGAPLVVELELAGPLIGIRGVVTKEEGTPVPGALLRSRDHTARTGIDGSFLIKVPADRSAQLTAYHPLAGVACLTIDPSSCGALDLRLGTTRVTVGTFNGGEAGDLRVVPADSEGQPDPLVPHWLTARPGPDGSISVPASAPSGPWFVIDKDGSVLAQLPARDVRSAAAADPPQ